MTENAEKISGDQHLTNAQRALLELVNHRDAVDIFNSLREIHSLGTYHLIDKDLVNLAASRQIQQLCDVIGEIRQEHLIAQALSRQKKAS